MNSLHASDAGEEQEGKAEGAQQGRQAAHTSGCQYSDLPMDTMQHILKYVEFKARDQAAIGLVPTRATAKAIREQLIESFVLGGIGWRLESAGRFLLRQPKFAELRGVKSFMSRIVEHSGDALEYAGPKLKKDREIVLAAVKQQGYALKYADPELKKDREIVLAAVKQNGTLLYYADPELQKDREIVLAAVTQIGLALEYADPELKKNSEIVLAALEQDGRALMFVDAELKGDKDVSTLLDELRLGQ